MCGDTHHMFKYCISPIHAACNWLCISSAYLVTLLCMTRCHI
uniref:Uncharacterized protein n=1 Tax=Rhizophora mucronata TaxID=61149 RepID=A0A2P2NZB6_RHIMU